MSGWEIALKFMHEGREWAKVLLPAALAWVHGWTREQPNWAKRRK